MELIHKNGGSMKAPYLKITICDNDFTGYAKEIGRILYDIFRFENTYPNEDDFDNIKGFIKHLWYSVYELGDYLRWKDTIVEYGVSHEGYIDRFEPDLQIIDYTDIPDWENGEVFYIPLFDCDGEIIIN